MSNIYRDYGDPAVLDSVRAMREQMEALRPQYEAATREIEYLTALNDIVGQSLAAAHAVDLAAEGNVAAVYGSDLAEAARAGIENIAANVEAFRASIDSRYGIDLDAVRDSLIADHDIGLDAVKASLAAAHGIDLEAMRASFVGGLGVDLDAARASLAAAHNLDLAAMRASLAGAYGIDLDVVKERLASAHGIDFEDLIWPEEPSNSAAGDADHLDGLGDISTNAPRAAADPAGGGASSKAWRVRRAWEVLQVLLTVDNFLGDPGMTAVREAAGGAAQAAQEVLLFVWLATIAQVPSPPPVPAIPVPETYMKPTHVTEDKLMDCDRLAERQPVTAENGFGMTTGDEESDGRQSDGSQ